MIDECQQFGFERRTVLKGMALAGIGASGFATASGSAAAQTADIVVDDDGSGDYTSIQEAVNNATAGDTISVKSGTYEEKVTVDTEVTLTGGSPPDGSNAAVVDGWIEVTASGTTVSQLKVTSSTTYTNSNWSRPGAAFAILVTASDVGVKGNVVEGITANSTPGGSFSINAIHLFGGSLLSGLEVVNNTVRDVFNDGGSGWPNHGGVAAIKLQADLDGVDVRRNKVTDLHSAGWVWGIVTADSGSASGIPKNATVEGNHVSESNDGSEFDVFANPGGAPYPGVAFGIDGNSHADGATVRFNDFISIPGGIQNRDGGSGRTLDAAGNWWGSESGPAESIDDGADERSAVFGAGDTAHSPWLVDELKETLRFPDKGESDDGKILDQESTVVYAGLNAISGTGSEPESLGASNAAALGAPTTDLTGDGSNDLPFVTGSGGLKVIDSSGNTETLVTSSDSSNPAKSKTLMTSGSWDGSDPSVFYADGDQATLYRVDGSGSVSTVAQPGNGVQAVTGIGDIDDDGTEELIFVDGSQQVRYLKPDGTIQKVSGGGAGSNNGIGVGKAADFDDNGVVRVALVDGSNNVKLVGSTESDVVLSDTSAKKSPVTVADVDNDGNLEVVYIGSNGHIKYVSDPLGAKTIEFLKNNNDNKVTATDTLGVVS